MRQKLILKFVDFGFAYHFVWERIVEVASLRNNMLNLICRCEKLAKRNHSACIRWTVFLFEPEFITRQLTGRRLSHLRNREYFLVVWVGSRKVEKCAFFIYAQNVLLHRTVWTHIINSRVVEKFEKQSLDSEIGIFVLLVLFADILSLISRILHLAT